MNKTNSFSLPSVSYEKPPLNSDKKIPSANMPGLGSHDKENMG